MNPHEPWTGVGSGLPSDPAYWDDLAHRIGVDAAPLLAELHGRGRWWSSLANHATPLALLAAAAMVAALTLFPARGGAEPAEADLLARTIEPSDPVIRGLVAGGGPPQLETLLLAEGGSRP